MRTAIFLGCLLMSGFLEKNNPPIAVVVFIVILTACFTILDLYEVLK